MTRTVYIGHDSREVEAFDVARDSLLRTASRSVAVRKVDAMELAARRLFWRPVERRGSVLYDYLSDAPQATEFATARFLVPFIHRGGWCLFVDCDVVFLADVEELFALADDRYAVMCVQHAPLLDTTDKMDNQPQTTYTRKNWSSVMLLNCDHPAHHRLSLPMVNHWPGALLHRFSWLRDEEIGSLPDAWNWLVGVQPMPENAKIAHFTLGGPWLNGWGQKPHDEIWTAARARVGWGRQCLDGREESGRPLRV